MSKRYWYNFFRVGYNAREVNGWCFAESPEFAALKARDMLMKASGRCLKGPATLALQLVPDYGPDGRASAVDPYSAFTFADVAVDSPEAVSLTL